MWHSSNLRSNRANLFNSFIFTHQAGEIWKRCSYVENPSNAFCPRSDSGDIWKRNNQGGALRDDSKNGCGGRLNNHRSFQSCACGNLRQEYHIIVMMSLFSNFQTALKRKAGVFISKSSGFKSVFEKLRFRDWIANGRPKPTNKAAYSDFSVALMVNR